MNGHWVWPRHIPQSDFAGELWIPLLYSNESIRPDARCAALVSMAYLVSPVAPGVAASIASPPERACYRYGCDAGVPPVAPSDQGTDLGRCAQRWDRWHISR
jgi:hypothetical protein